MTGSVVAEKAEAEVDESAEADMVMENTVLPAVRVMHLYAAALMKEIEGRIYTAEAAKAEGEVETEAKAEAEMEV